VVHADRKWHDDCFRCGGCDRALVGHACLLTGDARVYCGRPPCAGRRRQQLLPADADDVTDSDVTDDGDEEEAVDSPDEELLQRVDQRRQPSADVVRRQTTV